MANLQVNKDNLELVSNWEFFSCTHGGGVQSMMGVTGAQSISAVVSTTREMRPRPAFVRSRSEEGMAKNRIIKKV